MQSRRLDHSGQQTFAGYEPVTFIAHVLPVSRLISSQLLDRDCQFGRPFSVGGMKRREYFDSNSVSLTILREAAPMIDLKAVVSLVIAIEVQKDVHAVVVHDVRVANPLRDGFGAEA